MIRSLFLFWFFFNSVHASRLKLYYIIFYYSLLIDLDSIYLTLIDKDYLSYIVCYFTYHSIYLDFYRMSYVKEDNQVIYFNQGKLCNAIQFNGKWWICHIYNICVWEHPISMEYTICATILIGLGSCQHGIYKFSLFHCNQCSFFSTTKK